MERSQALSSITFTVHGGFTMCDLFSYEEKQNDCGLTNQADVTARFQLGVTQSRVRSTIDRTTGPVKP